MNQENEFVDLELHNPNPNSNTDTNTDLELIEPNSDDLANNGTSKKRLHLYSESSVRIRCARTTPYRI